MKGREQQSWICGNCGYENESGGEDPQKQCACCGASASVEQLNLSNNEPVEQSGGLKFQWKKHWTKVPLPAIGGGIGPKLFLSRYQSILKRLARLMYGDVDRSIFERFVLLFGWMMTLGIWCFLLVGTVHFLLFESLSFLTLFGFVFFFSLGWGITVSQLCIVRKEEIIDILKPRGIAGKSLLMYTAVSVFLIRIYGLVVSLGMAGCPVIVLVGGGHLTLSDAIMTCAGILLLMWLGKAFKLAK